MNNITSSDKSDSVYKQSLTGKVEQQEDDGELVAAPNGSRLGHFQSTEC